MPGWHGAPRLACVDASGSRRGPPPRRWQSMPDGPTRAGCAAARRAGRAASRGANPPAGPPRAGAREPRRPLGARARDRRPGAAPGLARHAVPPHTCRARSGLGARRAAKRSRPRRAADAGARLAQSGWRSGSSGRRRRPGHHRLGARLRPRGAPRRVPARVGRSRPPSSDERAGKHDARPRDDDPPAGPRTADVAARPRAKRAGATSDRSSPRSSRPRPTRSSSTPLTAVGAERAARREPSRQTAARRDLPLSGSQAAYRPRPWRPRSTPSSRSSTRLPPPARLRDADAWVDAFFAAQPARGPRHGASRRSTTRRSGRCWLSPACTDGLVRAEHGSGPSRRERVPAWASGSSGVLAAALVLFALHAARRHRATDLAPRSAAGRGHVARPVPHRRDHPPVRREPVAALPSSLGPAAVAWLDRRPRSAPLGLAAPGLRPSRPLMTPNPFIKQYLMTAGPTPVPPAVIAGDGRADALPPRARLRPALRARARAPAGRVPDREPRARVRGERLRRDGVRGRQPRPPRHHGAGLRGRQVRRALDRAVRGLRRRPVRHEPGWGTRLDPADIDRLLGENPGIEVVFATLSETSTGIVHDVQAIAEVVAPPRRAARRRRRLRARRRAPASRTTWGVDVVVAGSQKALMTPPGLAFASVSERALAAAAAKRPAAATTSTGPGRRRARPRARARSRRPCRCSSASTSRSA